MDDQTLAAVEFLVYLASVYGAGYCCGWGVGVWRAMAAPDTRD